MTSIGFFSLIGIFSHVFFIYLAWIAIQSINIDYFIRKGKVNEARMLMIFVSIVIGTMVSNFVLDILRFSQDLIYLF